MAYNIAVARGSKTQQLLQISPIGDQDRSDAGQAAVVGAAKSQTSA